MCEVKKNTREYYEIDFKNKGKVKFNNKFDYTDIIFINGRTPVTYKCPSHGFVSQRPDKHLSSVYGCYLCMEDAKNKLRWTTAGFINMAQLIHVNLDGTFKYDYSLSVYVNSKTKIKIICNTCKCVFEQNPQKHIHLKRGCPFCAKRNSTKNNKQFESDGRKVHGNRYGYQFVKYIHSNIPVDIWCIDGQHIFPQKPTNHLKGRGCNICKPDYFDNFKQKGKIKFNDKFEYIGPYINEDTEIKYICPTHGLQSQIPINHLQSTFGCHECYLDTLPPPKPKKIKLDKEKVKLEILYKFIEKGQNKYKKDDGITPKYGYEKVIMKPRNQKEIFICYEHGEFLQPRGEHLRYGCYLCGKKNLSENKLFNYIKNKFILYKIIQQGKPSWLGLQSFDIYFPKYNIAIEYQGTQHYKPIKHWGGEEQFKTVQNNDRIKRVISKQYDCKLFYFTYTKKDVPKGYPHKVYFDEDELIRDIQIEINKRS